MTRSNRTTRSWSASSARAGGGIGLEGDRYATQNGYWSDTRVSRDLTLIEAEAIEEIATEIGVELGLGDLRRNVVTRGVVLNALVGRRFFVGRRS